MEIQDLVRVLWRRKWTIIITMLLAGLIAIQFLRYKEDFYKSEARLATGFTTTDRVELVDQPNHLRDAEVRFNNLLELMNSTIMFDIISYQLLLHDLDTNNKQFQQPKDVSVLYEDNIYFKAQTIISNKFKNLINGQQNRHDINDLHTKEEINRVRQILKYRLNNLLPLHPDDNDFELIRRFFLEFGYTTKNIRESLVIIRLPNSDFIQIEFVSTNKHLSAFTANTFSQEFIRYYNSIKGETSSESVAFLKKVAEEKKKVVDDKLEMLRRFNSDDKIISGTDGNSSRMSQLVSLESQKNEITTRLQELELTIKRLTADLNNVMSHNSQNQEIMELQEKINELNNRYIMNGDSDKTLSDSLAYLRSNLRTMISSIDNNGTSTLSAKEIQDKTKDADIDYKVANNRLDMVESKIRELKYGFLNQNSNEGKVKALQNEIDVATKEYIDVANKYNEAKNRQVSGSSIQQVQFAAPAIEPVAMNKIPIVGLASLSSLAFTIFILVLKEITDGSIRTPYRFRQRIKLPLIGVLNKFDSKTLDIHQFFRNKKNNKKIEIYKSGLRQLRHQVISQNIKVILFTSLKPGEGKTTLIFSLAYVLSLLRKRVLVIDTNFKNSTITRIYGEGMKDIKVLRRKMAITNPVLAEVIQNGGPEEGKAIVETKAYDLINQTKYKDIFFVGNRGDADRSPAELLSGKDFGSFITSMAEQFDYVFLEGAALNDYSDSKELMGFVQKVITVFSATSDIDPIDQHSIDYIKSLRKKSGGAILNKVNLKDMNL